MSNGVAQPVSADRAPRVLARKRQELIVDEVRRLGAVRVSDLTALLRVSDMTIRRDLDILAAAGLLEKVHGGATAVPSDDRLDELHSSEEPGFEKKSAEQIAEKMAIAANAAQLIRPGTAIGLTAGTTTWHLAHLLGDVRDLVVVTNSIRVAEVIYGLGRPDHTVMVTGGVRTPSDALVGPLAEHALGTVHLDQVFMGVHGMSKRAGYSTPNLLEAGTNRAFVSAAQRLVVVADHTKWATVGISTIARLSDAHVVVTDDQLDPAAVAALRTEVADVRLAAAPPAASTPTPLGLAQLSTKSSSDSKNRRKK